jgi:hypothetical protein
VNRLRFCHHGPCPDLALLPTRSCVSCVTLFGLFRAPCGSHAQLAAENLFLRKQLALYMERQVKPRRADDATRIALVALSWLIDWHPNLTVVKPDMLIRWHRKGFQLLWRWKSRPHGRPRVPPELRRLIAEMASANRAWGEERIASELLVKLGIHVSPRTVRRYMTTSNAPRDDARSQRWSTFMRNHASAVLACDFFVVVTATFRVLYVFVVLEIGTRRIRALERNRTSDGGMDGEVVPDGDASIGRLWRESARGKHVFWT